MIPKKTDTEINYLVAEAMEVCKTSEDSKERIVAQTILDTIDWLVGIKDNHPLENGN